MSKACGKFRTQQQVAAHVGVTKEQEHFDAGRQRLLHMRFDAICFFFFCGRTSEVFFWHKINSKKENSKSYDIAFCSGQVH